VKNRKSKARDLKLSIQTRLSDQYPGMKVLDAEILSRAGKILGLKVAMLKKTEEGVTAAQRIWLCFLRLWRFTLTIFDI
jgi:hypothetical protein